MVQRAGQRGQPADGTDPNVGFSPTTPHSAAGMRIDPAVSVPMATSAKPAATAAAVQGVSHGAEVAAGAERTIGQGMQVGRSDDDGTGCTKASDDRGFGSGFHAEGPGSARGGPPVDTHDVLDGHDGPASNNIALGVAGNVRESLQLLGISSLHPHGDVPAVSLEGLWHGILIPWFSMDILHGIGIRFP